MDSENETGLFMRVTIQETGEDDTVDIWIVSGEKTLGALENRNFYVGSEQNMNSIDWTNALFR